MIYKRSVNCNEMVEVGETGITQSYARRGRRRGRGGIEGELSEPSQTGGQRGRGLAGILREFLTPSRQNQDGSRIDNTKSTLSESETRQRRVLALAHVDGVFLVKTFVSEDKSCVDSGFALSPFAYFPINQCLVLFLSKPRKFLTFTFVIDSLSPTRKQEKRNRTTFACAVTMPHITKFSGAASLRSPCEGNDEKIMQTT